MCSGGHFSQLPPPSGGRCSYCLRSPTASPLSPGGDTRGQDGSPWLCTALGALCWELLAFPAMKAKCSKLTPGRSHVTYISGPRGRTIMTLLRRTQQVYCPFHSGFLLTSLSSLLQGAVRGEPQQSPGVKASASFVPVSEPPAEIPERLLTKLFNTRFRRPAPCVGRAVFGTHKRFKTLQAAGASSSP